MTAHWPADGPRMDRRTVLAFGGALGLAAVAGCSRPQNPIGTATPGPVPTGTDPRRMPKATGLDTPWSLVRTTDGRILVSERDTARILALSPDGALAPLVHLPQVVAGGEAGLLGLEIIAASGGAEWLYAYLGTETDNRVVRLELRGSGVGPAEDILTGIPRANIHNGGRIKKGPDGLLYIGTGDATDQQAAQDPSRLNGKILRVNPDGSIPEANPFAGSPVYSYGHRNVQGLGWDSRGRLWASELGPEKNDEVNLIEPGKNYGWPEVTGVARDARFVDPIHVWPSPADASPSALAVAGDIAYVACLRGERLWELPLPDGDPPAGGTLPGARALLSGQEGRLRDVLVVGDELWVATNEGADSKIIALELPVA
ncbi:PQQ-dependent sugar dehydrogenase [Paeniglutamicibacter psychrophenolicus]|uniref:PQQ-dependent sugar dehydrogenase n=1 Tax=Paeniglutamicibacter psychrophenolicus TaxID=257454 RepID=UPI002785DBB9|nr:PQQ-dependent sugar dehydrogenase [Paeniglutamicibacter psychrophenolicus]MDQ0094365.1 glucose/arabinose dehydrogenase [Paeniglutamicibacter psychrophenolicus]